MGVAVAMALTVLTLAGCGGSSGGDGGGGGLSYKGNKEAAVITAGNAEEIAIGAFETGGESADLLDLGTDLAGGVVVVADGNGTDHSPLLLKLGNILTNQFNADELISRAEELALGLSESWTEEGNCGGKVTATISLNDAETRITASVTYSDYCDSADTEGATFDGRMSLVINIDPDTYDIDATFNFSNLTFSEPGGDDVTMHGSMVISEPDSGGMTMTTNLVMRDNNTDIYLKIEDYVITFNAIEPEMTISGRFYHSEHGYVDIVTTTELVFGDGDEPESGVMEITGAEGAKIKLQITTQDMTTYYVVFVDLDGEGYDFVGCSDESGPSNCPI